MKTILILCTGNSCRSQMGEAYARLQAGPECRVYSAGIEKHGLNPWMLEVMKEAGVDMSSHSSKTVDELPQVEWDLVVTVCSHARDKCPVIPGKRHVHSPFDDPPALAKGETDRENVLAIYRRVRDEIAARMPEILANLDNGEQP